MAKSFDTNVATSWITTDINSASKSEAKEVKNTETKGEEEKKSSEVKKETEKKEAKETKKVKSETTINIVSTARKTKAASFLLTESNHTKLVNLAKKNGISVNSCLNQILEQVL